MDKNLVKVWNVNTTDKGMVRVATIEQGERKPSMCDGCPSPCCLVEGTPILTPNGTSQIEHLKAGHIVSGLSTQRVLATFSRNYSDAIYTVKARSLPHIEFTKEHPILVGFFEKMINKREKPKEKWTFKALEWVETGKLFNLWKSRKPCYGAHAHDIRYYVVIPKESETEDIELHIGREKLILDRELAELFGWYLAEGWCIFRHGTGEVRFSLSKGEADVAARIQELLRAKCGKKSNFEVHPRTIEVVTYSLSLARFLSENFGNGAKNKVVPSWFLKAQPEIIELFLRTISKGDGDSRFQNSGRNYWHRIGLSSFEAVYMLQRLLRKLGRFASYSKSENYKENAFGRPGYNILSIQHIIEWADTPKHQFYREDKRFLYLPISKIIKENFAGKVYNIETEESIYLTPFIVHNCQGIFRPILDSEEFLSKKFPTMFTDVPEWLKEKAPRAEKIAVLAFTNGSSCNYFDPLNHKCTIFPNCPKGCLSYDCREDTREPIKSFVRNRLKEIVNTKRMREWQEQ